VLKITEVRIFPVNQPKHPKLKAFVTIVLEECFVIRDLKIIQGASELFLSMPAKKTKDGTYKDIVHPLNQETRDNFQDVIFKAFQEHNKGD